MVFETTRAKSVMKAVLRQGKQRYLQGKATALNPITLAFVGFSRNTYLFSILYLKQKKPKLTELTLSTFLRFSKWVNII